MIARTSPFSSVWQPLQTGSASHWGMPLPRTCHGADRAGHTVQRLGIADVSATPRWVVKGPSAGATLSLAGLPAPNDWYRPSRVGEGASGRFTARTAKNEYLVEGEVAWLPHATGASIHARENGSLLLSGTALEPLLAEVLGVSVALGSGELVPTELAAVTCVVWLRAEQRVPCVQVWMDPSYCAYAGGVLLERAEELGGGWVGSEAMVAAGLLSLRDTSETPL